MQLLKQSTAATVLVGPVLDSAGLAITTAVIGDFQLTKNGTTAALASPATATHSHNGNYLIALSTGNTDTAGRMDITVNNAAQAMGTHRYTVLVASVFDAIVTNATNTTGGLPTATGTITALAGAVSTFAGGSVASVTTPVTVGTNNDKTGYTATVSDKTGFSLTPTTGLGNQTANITGNLSGSVGSVTGAVGSVASYGSLVNDIATAVWSAGTRTLTSFGTLVNDVATAVWGALLANHTTADSFGARIIRSVNTNNAVQITGGGSNHIFAVLHDAEPNSIPEDAFVSGALSARALASDAANEIATAVSGIQVLSRLDSMIEDNGSGQFRFDTIAVSMVAGGAGGTDWNTNERTAFRTILGFNSAGDILDPSSGILDNIRDLLPGNQTINVYPVSASTPERVAGTTITYYRNEIRSVSVVTDFTLTNLTLSLTIEDAEGTDLLTIANASITRSGQTFTVSIGTSVTSSVGNKRWALRDLTGGTNSVIARGVFSVQEAASA